MNGTGGAAVVGRASVRSWSIRQMLAAAGTFFILGAGVLHLWAAPAHWEHAPAHGLFLALAGLVEVALGVAFLFRPSARLYRTARVFAGGLITLYAITRVLPAPFGHGPEEPDGLGLAMKLLEGLAMAALAALSVSGRPIPWPPSAGSGQALPGAGRGTGFPAGRGDRGRDAWYGLCALLAVAFATGWLAYGAGATAGWALDAAGIAPAQDEHEHDEHEHAATSAEDAPAPSMTINVDVTDAGIQPSSIFIPLGKRVRLVVRNRDSTERHYVVAGLVPRDLLWLSNEPTPDEVTLVEDGAVTEDQHAEHHRSGRFVPFRSRSPWGIKPLGFEVHAYAAGGAIDVVLFTATARGTFSVVDPLHPEASGKVTVF
ncbi:MAG: hypothetical protein HYY05_06850 [Chloroflexi bacterium]|nr:hypothetical protein [Chloroflexota bacterium]